MATVPCIVEPSPTPGTTKSRLHSLFRWRRSSSSSQRPSPHISNENATVVPVTYDSGSAPNYSSQSRHERAPPVALAKKHSPQPSRDRKQEKIVADPPPLAQVHGQALLHASLEAPVSYWEKSRSRRPSFLSGDSVPRNFTEETIEVKRSHKKTGSGQSCCSTQGKVFFLIHGPYILQYNGDSEGNALPEKILVLDKDSVAGICDAVPGRPWVLQISKRHNNLVRSQAQTLRPSWSRLTLRQPEDRRTVNNLLLIFDDSEDLYTWLHAIRKEIEHLGGMECDHEEDENDQSWRDDLTKKFASSADNDSPSDKVSTSRPMSLIVLPLISNAPTQPNLFTKDRSQSTKSVASSKKTSTSLDRLRDSVTSHSYASTLATSSGCGSAPALSPTGEQFPSINSVTDHSVNDLYLRSYSPQRGLHQRPASSSTPGRSILERRKLSVESLHLVQAEELKARKMALALPSPVSASPIDPLPEPAQTLPTPIEKATNADPGCLSSTTIKSVSSRDDLDVSGNDQKILSRKASLIESAGGPPKARYSLFPTQQAPGKKPEVLKTPTEPILSESSSCQDHTSMPNPVDNIKSAPKHKKSRSRVATLELRQHRISTLLAAGDYGLPQRSPAVTDDMIMSNFGIGQDGTPTSPMPDIKVPGLGDLHMDLDFLKGPYRTPYKQSSTLETSRSSGALSSSGSQRAKTPLGPPPAAPLPAVPSGSRSSSRTQRSRQHSQSSVKNSTKRETRIHTNAEQQRSIDPKPPTYEEPPIYGSNVDEPRSRHRRTISSSLDGLPPASRPSNSVQGQTGQSKSRSRSRGRQKSSKKQS